MTLVSAYAGVVCDLDGVVYRGGDAVENAVEALARLDVPVLYATNNASRTPAVVSEHLVSLGLTVQESAVVTSSQAAAAHVAHAVSPGARVLALGGDGVSAALEEAGLVPVRPGARGLDPLTAVVQGYGREVSVAELSEAAYAVQGGALWVATNDDITIPTEQGMAPGNGSLVAAVRNAVDHDPVVVGKPHPPLYLLAAQRTGLEPHLMLAVGDRLGTDIAGAVAAGLDSVLVLTGVDSPSTLAAAGPGERPTYVLQDLRGLHEEYVGVTHEDGWFVCGDQRLRVEGQRWADGSSPVPGQEPARVQWVRAAAAAVHEACDAESLTAEDARTLLAQA